MILYTVIPPELIFDEEPDCNNNNNSHNEVEIKHGSVSLLVEPTAGGQGKVTRVISTDPQDYLKPEWQPGTVMLIS